MTPTLRDQRATEGGTSVQSYAVLWSNGDEIASGRLDRFADRFELHGREQNASISLSDLAGAEISRRASKRLRGLPVLVLRGSGESTLRIASLEGAGVLHELLHEIELG